MYYICEDLSNRQSYIKFFLALSNKSLFFSLIRLNFSSYKFPEKRTRFCRWSLTYEEPIFIPYYS